MSGFARPRRSIQPSVARQTSVDTLKLVATRCLLAGLIVGIFALSRKHLVLAALAGCVAVFACLSWVRPLHRISVVVLLNYLWWVLSGAVSGGLQWASLTSNEFWRGEGRCFLFYLPLVAVSIMSMRAADLRFIVRLICVLTVVGAILCALWLMGLGYLFQTEVDDDSGDVRTHTYFVGLLTSHTGAGAFWATVMAFLLGYSLRLHDKRVQALAILAAMLTLGTGGRAATLGLVAVVAWLLWQGDLLNRRTMKVAIPVLFLSAVASWGVALWVPKISERMAELFEPRTFSSVMTTIRQPVLKYPSGYFLSGAGMENHNLVIRVFLWKYALYLFSQSPLIGVGFGRFNDTNLDYAGVPHFINLAVDGEAYFGSGIRWEGEQLMTSTGNAHNSYLHMLAETGIIGLALFLYLWFLMYRYCQARRTDQKSHESYAFEAAYCHGCQAAIICLLVTSLAGHALAAPSGGVLLTTIIGAWLGYSKTATRSANGHP